MDAGYLTLGLGDYRGVYNSAWIGSAAAVLTSTLLSLPAFYLVKNAVERDQQTGVGQIIATTPLSKPLYTLGKAFSNFVFLAVMVGAIALSALAMQLIRGEELRIDLWALLSPFLFIALPAMAVVAAIAVLFETVSWLRGSFGNVAYVFLWMGLLVMLPLMSVSASGQATFEPINDALGVTIPLSNMTAAAKAAFPDYDGAFSIGAAVVQDTVRTFRWEGIRWTAEIILGRLMWIGIALGITLVAALFFDRFDPAREGRKRARQIVMTSIAPQESAAPEEEIAFLLPIQVHLTPISAATQFRFLGLLLAELRVMLKALPWWWYLIALVLIVASLLTPTNMSRQYLLPVAWVWPLVIWSSMGSREARHHTEQLVFSAAHALRRQLPATWLAGVIVAVLTGGGVAVRLVLAGDWTSMLAWTLSVLFIPSLALALGCWSGNSKLFEVVYMILWYLGPVNQVPFLDFIGASSVSIATGVPLIYLICTIMLLGLVVVGRQRQLHV